MSYQKLTIEQAEELQQQAIEGRKLGRASSYKVRAACHKIKSTKAYEVLGYKSYNSWGAVVLMVSSSTLYILAKAGAVQQELLDHISNNP